jgi:hypothetical protein
VFYSKLNSTGVEQWSFTWGSTIADTANAMTIDASGNLYIAGETANYGAGGDDAFLAKFDSAGAELWSNTVGGTGNEYARAVALDTSGNIIIVGDTTSWGVGSGDNLIARFDSTGSIANCSSCATQSITEAFMGMTEINQTVTEANQTVTETIQSPTRGGLSDAILVICGEVSSSTKLWDNGDETGNSITTDTLGNSYATGSTNGSGAGGYDAFIIKSNSGGIEQWSKTWGGASDDVAFDIAVERDGSIFITGTTSSFGAGNTDAFIAKFNSSGVEQWSKPGVAL